MTTAPDHAQVLREAEQWFLRHGLPYFVESERAHVRRGLARGRLLPVVGLALLLGAAGGLALGLLVDSPAGVVTGLWVSALVLASYAATTLRCG